MQAPAMWSQQWPGLRSSFSFRTAQGDDSRRSELIDYNVQVGGGGVNSTSGAISESTWPTWVVAASSSPIRAFAPRSLAVGFANIVERRAEPANH